VSTEYVLLTLRVITAALLISFLITLFFFLWRDYHVAASAVMLSQRQRGRLVVIQSDDGAATPGNSYPLLPLTSLGRSPTNTIVLVDTFCSQEHALVTWRGGQWWLEDRDSSNGTRLNNELIEEPVVISSGDVIGIGRVELKLELE
jgi:hypothetical protein